jgi:hypothetical protein
MRNKDEQMTNTQFKGCCINLAFLCLATIVAVEFRLSYGIGMVCAYLIFMALIVPND